MPGRLLHEFAAPGRRACRRPCGRPRRPPVPAGAPRRRGAAGVRGRAWRRRGRAVADSAERLVGGLELLVLLHGRLELLQARLDLLALLVEKIGHLSVTPGKRVNCRRRRYLTSDDPAHGHIAGQCSRSALSCCSERVRLTFGHAAHHHPAGRRAQQSARRLELVLVLEMGAVAVGCEAVTGARV